MINHKTNKKKMDILAVILDVGLTVDNSSVFQSQVIDQLVALKEMGYQVGLLCVYSDKDIFLNGVCKQLENHGIQLFYDEDRGLIRNFIAMAIKLRVLKKNMDISNGYARGLWGALLMIISDPINPVSYLYDIRGDLLDETKAVGTNFFKAKLYIFLEKIAIACSTHVSVVSSVLEKIIKKRMWKNKNISIIPSCIDYSKFGAEEEEILLKREKLGFSQGEIVLLYAGGLSHYQKVPEMLELWLRLHNDCNNIRFILLTNSDPHSLPSDVVGLDQFGSALQIYNLPRSEVFSMLCIADVAFLLRDDRDLNKAASPVKFAEYIASGLAVIGSPNTGDTSNHIEENKLGMLISPNDLYDKYDQLLAFIKSFKDDKKSYSVRSKNLAENNYDWQSHRETFIEIYGLPNLIDGEC